MDEALDILKAVKPYTYSEVSGKVPTKAEVREYALHTRNAVDRALELLDGMSDSVSLNPPSSTMRKMRVIPSNPRQVLDDAEEKADIPSPAPASAEEGERGAENEEDFKGVVRGLSETTILSDRRVGHVLFGDQNYWYTPKVRGYSPCRSFYPSSNVCMCILLVHEIYGRRRDHQWSHIGTLDSQDHPYLPRDSGESNLLWYMGIRISRSEV